MSDIVERLGNSEWDQDEATADAKSEITALRAAVESRDAEIAELNETIATAIAAIQREENWLGELLAIIHRDGGHHQVKVGTDQAVKDAHRIWADLQSQRDAQLSSQRKELREAAEIYDEQLDKIESQEARIKELENENHAISEGVSASIARIKALEEGLMDTSRFIDDLADADLDDIVADVGLTVGLAFQMEAKTVYGPRARSLLPPAQGETRGRQDGL